MKPVVRLDQVTKRFGDLVAVRDLTLEIEQGEFLTLLGPSGCGKTTTLRMISGFETPDAGQVEIDGETVTALPPFRRNVNTVFQNYALFPHLSVFDNVAYGLSIKRQPKREIRARVTEMLDRVDLSDKGKNLPQQLSGGQMQRVALARALINEPRVLLLDEPLGALDAKLRRAMQIELKHMQERLGITFIYVTHDQEEALVMSDRVAVLDGGILQQLATPDEIFERPGNLFVAEFVGATNFFPGRVTRTVDSVCEVALENGMTVEADAKNDIADGQNVVVAVRPQKIKIGLSGPSGSADSNSFPVTFQEAIYEGTLVRFVLTLPGGQRLEAQTTPEALPTPYTAFKPGSPMTVFFPADAMLVYAA